MTTRKPVLHLICNAHLDPVWQWRWEEGAAEAVATFAIAARLLREFPRFVFNHNESILYRWVQEHDPPLFAEIQRLAAEGRWCIAGGWDLQPDVNMPGTEALIRHIAEGRRYFRDFFGAVPRVAYNLDSFGHSGGLPQLLSRAGYAMYVHMRPGEKDMPLPSDLYRWQGVDGSTIAAYRIPFKAYNTFPGAAVERINEAAELALRLRRDTPVFWGLGDHGGGATRAELEAIEELIQKEDRVTILHSSTERYYEAVKEILPSAPLVAGDLQRVFTGCYTSMARLKRRMGRNLGELLQTEGARAAAWWLRGKEYPREALRDAWRDHLFNDFHDILPGSSVEAGELDALDLYGRSSETHRRLRLGAVSGFSAGTARQLQIPITVLNTNPAGCDLPVELEYMIDHLPRMKGEWQARLLTLEGEEVSAQEEKAEMLLLADQWRRKICFRTVLPHVGAAHFQIELREGRRVEAPAAPALIHRMNPATGLVNGIDVEGMQLLSGDCLRTLVVDDDADSWGMERWNYRDVAGEFAPIAGSQSIVESGSVRTIREAAFSFQGSSLVLRTIAYAAVPILEYRLRLVWNEERKRVKLSIPTLLRADSVLCEIPGGAIRRPADGEEHTHGRWLIMSGRIGGKDAAIGLINSGQHGFDVRDGEIRLSALRSAPYCHERTFKLGDVPRSKVMDLGVHDIRLLLFAGAEQDLRRMAGSYADWLSAPPYALAHYPIGEGTPGRQELFRLEPASIRLLACTESRDGSALVVRVQEVAGERGEGTLTLTRPSVEIPLTLAPFEIRTLRCERDGNWRFVGLLEDPL